MIVALTSSDTAAATVPANVAIATGSSSARSRFDDGGSRVNFNHDLRNLRWCDTWFKVELELNQHQDVPADPATDTALSRRLAALCVP